MPSKSKAQHNLMAMVANDPKAAKRLGIPRAVGEEYMQADKGRKFAKGGSMQNGNLMGMGRGRGRGGNMPSLKKMRVGRGRGPIKPLPIAPAGGPMRYAEGGSVTRADGICKKGHTKGKMV